MDGLFLTGTDHLVYRLQPANLFLPPPHGSPSSSKRSWLVGSTDPSVALERIFRKEELSNPRFISLLRDEIRMWIFAGAKHLDSLVGHIFSE